ncbi:MAG: hypothetical protein IIB00_00825 [candidate division Zixibacteria bacterium]|nr:hypothetical protein [candidate division Zixibacteria bacterium]
MNDLTRQIRTLFITAYSGNKPNAEFCEFVTQMSPSGIILFEENCDDHKRLKESIEKLNSLTETNLLFAIDQEGGRVCRLRGEPAEFESPTSFGEKARNDIESALENYTVKLCASLEYMRDLGINFLLGPVCDIKPDNTNSSLNGRTFGTNVEVISKFVATTVASARKYDFFTCLKHAPGLGAAFGDPHTTLATSTLDQDSYANTELIPFQAGVSAGADAIMTSHFVLSKIDNEPITFSQKIISGLIRPALSQTLPFITDDLDMRALDGLCTFEERVVRAFNAGHDLLLTRCVQSTKRGVEALERSLDSGEISPERVKQAVKRVKRFQTPPRNSQLLEVETHSGKSDISS